MLQHVWQNKNSKHGKKEKPSKDGFIQDCYNGKITSYSRNHLQNQEP